MGKFSLKKKDDGDEDSHRMALFGASKKSKAPAPPTQNPYAQPSVPPDPYTQAKMRAGLVPGMNGPAVGQPYPQQGAAPNGSYGNMNQPPPRGGYSRDNSYGPPSDGADNRFGPSQGGYGGGGYGQDKFGSRNQYGMDNNSGGSPYANAAPINSTSRYGPGGYGGLGRLESNDTASIDENRDELFKGARERVQQKQQSQLGQPPDYEYNSAGATGQERSYGTTGDRQLTAEEEEEEDIEATKQEIKFMRKQDVSSTRNALRAAEEAERSGRDTLARLGAQGERLHNTEHNLDLAENQNRIAEDKVKELKTLNRSMWAVHVNNPFTAGSRREKREEEIMSRHHLEREQRESTREQAYQSHQRMNRNFKGMDDAGRVAKTESSAAERGKYLFEANSEDERDEDEIENNLGQLEVAVGRLNFIAKATNEEAQRQIDHLDRMAPKIDKIDDDLHLGTERMKRIH